MSDASRPLKPGAMIGVLGGGQLGRMLSLAAARLGMRTHIYCPDAQSPAFEVTPHKTVAAYDDASALAEFAGSVNVVTYEFENVPVSAAHQLEGLVPLHPGSKALSIAQDRRSEKRFLTKTGIPVADWAEINSQTDLAKAVTEIGLPGVLKTARLGYDGKGQRMLRTNDDLSGALEELGGKDLVLEAFVPFVKEISIIAARSADGVVQCYDPSENVHENHILSTSTVPAGIDAETASKAAGIARDILSGLDYVGVMGIEFFVVGNGGNETLIVNEIAPRVHNSGHWTEAVCVTDQFEQHIRAICGWPLGDTLRLSDVVMHNLVGDEVETVPNGLTGADRPQLYGKTETRPGRKMGHFNRVAK